MNADDTAQLPGSGKPTGPLRVLLVEDDERDQEAFRRRIASDEQTYAVVAASSVAEARAVLAQKPFDVLVTDYRLPDGTAFDVSTLAPGLPWIIVTGHGGEDVVVEALRAGAFDYVQKGADLSYLDRLSCAIGSAARLARADAEKRMLAAAVASTKDAVYITDLDGKILFVNPAFRELYGYEPSAALGASEALLWPADHPGLDLDVGDVHQLRSDGSAVPVWLSRAPITDYAGRHVGNVCTARDTSDRRYLEEALKRANDALVTSLTSLEELAIRDELTGLLNRREIRRLFDEEAVRAKRSGSVIGLVLIDIDHFKSVNDTYGHGAGDEVLRNLARFMKGCLRPYDRAGRLGGEEFVVLLPETDLAGAIVVAERIRTLARTPIRIASHEGPGSHLQVSISAGVVSGSGSASFDELTAEADRALYRAKSTGRNRVECAGATW